MFWEMLRSANHHDETVSGSYDSNRDPLNSHESPCETDENVKKSKEDQEDDSELHSEGNYPPNPESGEADDGSQVKKRKFE